MEIKRYQTKIRMSRVVEHNATLYFCGQTAKDDSADIKGQTATALEKVEELLNEAGSDKSRMLSVTIYLSDMANFKQMNEVWDSWVAPGQPPARACVEAKMARPELLVELSVIAAKA